MKKFTLFCCLAATACNTTPDNYGVIPKDKAWVVHDDHILKTLQEEEALPRAAAWPEKEVVPAALDIGCAIKRALRVTDSHGHQYFIKETLNSDEIEEEQKYLKSQSVFQEVVENYEEGPVTQLIRLYGATSLKDQDDDEVHITVMDNVPASGVDLLTLWEEYVLARKITPQKHIAIAKSIGEQLGHLSNAFLTSEHRSILLHGDMGPQNYMYDLAKDQYYWIDLGATELASEPTDGINSDMLISLEFDQITTVIEGVCARNYLFADYHCNEIKKKERNSNWVEESCAFAKNALLAESVFMKQYLSALTDNKHRQLLSKVYSAYCDEQKKKHKENIEKFFDSNEAQKILEYMKFN